MVSATAGLEVTVPVGLMLTELLSSFTVVGVWIIRVCSDDVEVADDGVGVIVCIDESVKQNNEHSNS